MGQSHNMRRSVGLEGLKSANFPKLNQFDLEMTLT